MQPMLAYVLQVKPITVPFLNAICLVPLRTRNRYGLIGMRYASFGLTEHRQWKKNGVKILLLKCRYLQPRLEDEWGAPRRWCRQWHFHSVPPLWSRVLLLAAWIPPWIPLLAFTRSQWSQQEPRHLAPCTHLLCRHLTVGEMISIQGVSTPSKLQLVRSSGTRLEPDHQSHCDFFPLDEFLTECRREGSFLRWSFSS